MEGRGRISRSGLTQGIKMGSCVFHCDVPHQWIAQWQVGPMSVYCDGLWCHVLCLRHGISVWQHIVTTATSRHCCDDLRCLKATLNPNKKTNRQTSTHIHSFIRIFIFCLIKVDCSFVFIQWLVKKAIETKEELGDYIRAFSISQFNKTHSTPQVCWIIKARARRHKTIWVWECTQM